MDRTLVFSAGGILTLVAAGFALSLHGRSSEPQPSGLPTAVTEPVATTAPAVAATIAAVASASSPPVTTPPTEALTEPDLMAKLRDLGATAPLLTLQLAREGNQRFANSSDAAERTWYVVKSLSDLGRHDEAREEARKMVELFPRNRFTSDVVRHTLIHPPGPPAQ